MKKKCIIFVAEMAKIITEITPLTQQDCFYLADRFKKEFDFPIHCHKEIELNLVSNCEGCQRIVGDSIETLEFYDLALVGGSLIHGWQQNGMPSDREMREITIQWDYTMLNEETLNKKQFYSIKKLTERMDKGIVFGQETIKEILPFFDELVSPQSGFTRYLKFLEILYILSLSEDYRILSTPSFVHSNNEEIYSKRIQKVKDYISSHYETPLKLEELASMVGLTPQSFSRFFKKITNQTVTDYILDVRLGNAIRNLVDTDKTVSEICYESGFNNLSNFNRLFKKKKGYSPKEFRMKYNSSKIII